MSEVRDAPVSEVETGGLVAGRHRSVEELTARIDDRVSPTPEQQEIIGGGLEPTLVVAGAGSGKTETLSMRMVYVLDHAERLLGHAISPDQILCLTFTRKAATEIAARAEERIRTVFGDDPSRPPVTVSTYNGYAASLVAEHGLRIGVDPDSATITDAALWQLAASVTENWQAELDFDGAASTVMAAIPSLSQEMAEHGVSTARLRAWAHQVWEDAAQLPANPSSNVPGGMLTRNGTPNGMAKDLSKVASLAALTDLVDEFRARKLDRAVMDFSDQIAYAQQLAGLSAVQDIERSRYRVVLLDEFQDTSPGQLQLFHQMFGDAHPVMAVGDPHQAIYGFRGASARALNDFAQRFGGGAVSRKTLSVSWRNEGAVLEIANAVAAPLRATAGVDVEPLHSKSEYLRQPEPVRASAGVQAHMASDTDAEAQAVVEFIVARRHELAGGDVSGLPVNDWPSAAVLCRKRKQIAPIVQALEAEGIDYEVVGLGGLLETPEVGQLVALLQVAHDPSRGDALMALLTSERLALGPRDLMALGDRARELTEDREWEPASIVDALDSLPSRDWVSPQGRAFTEAALERLHRLRRVVAAVRERTYLPVTELIVATERLWGLDIEAAVARPDGRASRTVDALVDAARTFAAGAEYSTLGAFLEWLRAAQQEERGLSAPVKEMEPGAVQILTCHAAKGLEWDIVAIPGMTQGDRSGVFPAVTPPSASADYFKDSGWFGEAGALPYELRLDQQDLPEWDRKDVSNQRDLKASIVAFKQDAGEYRIEEERRLFYVALTRARSHVLLAGSWWGTNAGANVPSLFVRELVESGHVAADGWAEPPGPDELKPEVAPEDRAVAWPRPVTPNQQRRRALAAEVNAVRDTAGADAPWDDSLPLAREISAMLRERQERVARGGEVELPRHLSTSALVSMRRSREEFAVQLRRPIPTEPTSAAQRGSLLHAWIESQLGHTSLLSTDDFGDDPADTDSTLAQLRDTWARSEWASRTPSDIEVDVELPVAGITVRSRIDAVFPAGKGLDRVTVVDWKSGRPPRDPEERAAREVQLAVYRLAWAAWKGLDVNEVDAAFYYVASDDTVRPVSLLNKAELEALIAGN